MDEAAYSPFYGTVTETKTPKSEVFPFLKFPAELRLLILMSAFNIPPYLPRHEWVIFSPARCLAIYFTMLGGALSMLSKLVEAASDPNHKNIAFVQDVNKVLAKQLDKIEEDVYDIVSHYDKEYKQRWTLGADGEWFNGYEEILDAKESILALFKKELQSLYNDHYKQNLDTGTTCDLWNTSRLNAMIALHDHNRMAFPLAPEHKDGSHCNIFSFRPHSSGFGTLEDNSRCGSAYVSLITLYSSTSTNFNRRRKKPWTLFHFERIGQIFIGKNFAQVVATHSPWLAYPFGS